MRRVTGALALTAGRLVAIVALATVLATADGARSNRIHTTTTLHLKKLTSRHFGRKYKPQRGPGQLPGVPHPNHFKWTVGLEDMCRRGPEHFDIRGFPLNFPVQRSYRDAFLSSTETPPAGYAEAWERLTPYLPERIWPVNSQLDSCAVVGHAHWMRDKTYGGEINQHATVFRFNKDPTAGLETLVGNRTSFRFLDRLHAALYSKEKKQSSIIIAAGEEGIQADKMEMLPKEPGLGLILARVTPLEAASRMKRMHRNFASMRRSDISTSVFHKDVLRHVRRMMYEARTCLQMGGMTPSEEPMTPSLHVAAVVTSILACNHVTVYGVGYEDRTGHLPRHGGCTSTVSTSGTWSADIMFTGQYANYADADGMLRDHYLEDTILTSMSNMGLIRLCGPQECLGRNLPSYIRPSDPIPQEEVELPVEDGPAESESDLYGDRDNDDFTILVD